MNPQKEEHEIKALADFEALINQGKTSYTGLVESVGYVYWVNEPIYFVRTNPKELFATPTYQQVPGPYCMPGGNPVITQTVQRLYIKSEKDLMKDNYSMYYQFYVLPKELQKQTCETDAIPSNKEQSSQTRQIEAEVKLAKRKFEKAKDTWSAIDTASSMLEDAGVIKLPKWLSHGQSGMTGVFIAIDLYLKGDHVNAVGEVVQALNPYGTFFEVAKAMYNSDLMQQRILEDAVPGYLRAVNKHRSWTEQYNKAKGREKDKIEAILNQYANTAGEYYKLIDASGRKLEIIK